MLRRTFDLVAAGLGLLILSPLFLVLAVVIKMDSPGAVFFRQVRVGRDGRHFRIHKFRTMRQDAERLGGPLTVGADPRITRIGAFLRRTKLDEVPQLIDVVKGDMALVGPRPEVPKYVGLYTPEQRRVLEVLPGITDPASIHYRDESAVLASAEDPERTYVENVMPHKVTINLAYQARRTLLSDIGVILATLARLLRRGEDADGPDAARSDSDAG